MRSYNLRSLALGTVLFLTGISSAHAALDYTLQALGNDTFKNYSIADYKSLLGADAAYLPQFVCDGKTEYDIYEAPIRSNPKGDSLRINVGSKTYVYQNGAIYNLKTGKKPWLILNSFVHQTLKALQKLETLPDGKKLVDLLEHSYYPLVIVQGENRFFTGTVDGHPGWGIYRANVISAGSILYETTEAILGQIGTDGYINFDPNGSYQRIESDGVVRDVPTHVALAHESFHALDSIRGLLDLRFVSGTTYESEQVDEYRAVYFENIIRKESGLLYAKYYGTTNVDEAKGTPGMLDANGNQRLIPAPCIDADVLSGKTIPPPVQTN